MNNAFALGHFPIVIEPTVEVLELKQTDDAAIDLQASGNWAHFVRVDLAAVLQEVSVPVGSVHFFGPSAVLAECQFLLGYSPSGLLRCYVRRLESGELDAIEAPPETTGGADQRPSVRLVFKDKRGRDGLLYYLARVDAGSISNPALAMLLTRLDQPPIVITSAVVKAADART